MNDQWGNGHITMSKLSYRHICARESDRYRDKCGRESLNRIIKKDKDTRSALKKLGWRKHLQPRSELHYPISTRVIASWLVRGYIVSRMRWYEFGNRAICQCCARRGSSRGRGRGSGQRRQRRMRGVEHSRRDATGGPGHIDGSDQMVWDGMGQHRSRH